MTKQDEIVFTSLIMALSEVFDSGNEPSPAKVEIYFKALVDYSIDSVGQAVNEIIQTRTFATFPKPAEIIQAIEGKKEDQSLLAWEKVDKAVRLTGPYQSVEFDDPVIHSAISFLGGWEKLCQTTEIEWKWKQKEFERIYTIMAKRGGQHPKYLIGITEASNQSRFKEHIVGPLVRIGFDGEETKQIEHG